MAATGSLGDTAIDDIVAPCPEYDRTYLLSNMLSSLREKSDAALPRMERREPRLIARYRRGEVVGRSVRGYASTYWVNSTNSAGSHAHPTAHVPATSCRIVGGTAAADAITL